MLTNIQYESKTANDEKKKKTYLEINKYEIFLCFFTCHLFISYLLTS